MDRGTAQRQGTPKEIAQLYLAALYESQQGDSTSSLPAIGEETPETVDLRDMRLDFINTTAHRNDIELFQFVPDTASFGKGGGSIVSVQLFDENGRPLAWVVGGERVAVRVVCRAHADLANPIIGFLVNDKLGQALFGDNTYLSSLDKPLIVAAGETFAATFSFRMPILPQGDYAVTVALAEGTQKEHVQHHWMHEAILLKSHSSSISTGLVGVPMNKITMKKI